MVGEFRRRHYINTAASGSSGRRLLNTDRGCLIGLCTTGGALGASSSSEDSSSYWPSNASGSTSSPESESESDEEAAEVAWGRLLISGRSEEPRGAREDGAGGEGPG